MTDDLEAFRAKCRAFLDQHAPKITRTKSEDDDEEVGPRYQADIPTAKKYQAALFDAGLAGITWPEPWGQGLTSEHQRVFNEEVTGRDIPAGLYTIGLGMVIPTIIEHGTDEQRALRGEGAARRGSVVAVVL